MSSRENILNSIRQESINAVNAIKADSARACDEVLKKAEIETNQAKAEIKKKASLQAARIKAANKSRAELEQRNALLKNRRNEIDITFNSVYDYLINLKDQDYFEFILKLLAKLKDSDGTIYFNRRDLTRLPSDFAKQLSTLKIKANLSEDTVDIDGGFILKNGDIEENMSIKAMLSANRDSIEDLINRQLFEQ